VCGVCVWLCVCVCVCARALVRQQLYASFTSAMYVLYYFFFFGTVTVCWHSAVPFHCIQSECRTPESKIGLLADDMSTAFRNTVMVLLNVWLVLWHEKSSLILTCVSCNVEHNFCFICWFIQLLAWYSVEWQVGWWIRKDVEGVCRVLTSCAIQIPLRR
jgi:hypothetical protein